MKKFIKRLPCLLLALVFVVMPLMMAVPVNASILDGVTICSIEGIPLPSDFSPALIDSFVIVVCVDSVYLFQEKGFMLAIDALGDGLVVRSNIAGTSYYRWTGIPIVENDALIAVDWSARDTGVYTSVESYAFCAAGSDVSVGAGIELIEFNMTQSTGNGIFSVFNGVGSWLTSAVGEMTTMFWTAEGGLSVLGVLAVASLAIAFIVLLIYLLAGWMKFK